jgi:chemotaxis protein MotA
MDLATVIGLMGGMGLVLSAIILGGSAIMFINIPGILIVVGGTIATCFIKFSMGDVINTIKVVLKAFLVKMDAPEKIVTDMVSFSKIAKKEGLIALEGENIENEFATKALRYLADGYDEEIISDILNKDIALTTQRHKTGQNIFKGMGASAPAFGMIGTLIGLVQMLANMSEPSAIGPAMAVALLTTLYGALMANLFCLPLADKLALRCQQEQESRSIIREAAIGICQAVSPMILEESLKIYLRPKDRPKVNGDETNKEGDT